MLTLRHC